MKDTQVVEEYINQFRDKYLKETQSWSIEKPADVFEAVCLAYVDMMPRTIAGLKGKFGSSVKKKCCNYLSSELSEYFRNEQPQIQNDFDDWHSQTCHDFLEILNDKLREKELKEQEYGKAQKIVNMSFKYLYCFDDMDQKRDWFTFCHMPLDKFTLNWLCDLPANSTNIAWSNLSETGYKRIQGVIRSVLQEPCSCSDKKLPSNPMLADYVIWGLSSENA